METTDSLAELQRKINSHKDQMMIHPTDEKKRTIELLEQLLAKQKEELEAQG